jgi:lipopolysaccharide transport system permease protein
MMGLQAVVAGEFPGLHSLILVPALIWTVVVASAFALVLGALNVYFRDFRFLIQAALIAWFYVTPVFYPLSAVGRVAPWIKVNPATAIVELFRLGTAGADPGWVTAMWWSLGWTAVLLAFAAALYRRFDRVFPDLI